MCVKIKMLSLLTALEKCFTVKQTDTILFYCWVVEGKRHIHTVLVFYDVLMISYKLVEFRLPKIISWKIRFFKIQLIQQVEVITPEIHIQAHAA